MQNAFRFLTLIVAIALLPVSAMAQQAGPDRDTPAPVILISLDGFRFDYLDRGITPNLQALAQRGLRADAMRPRFPSKTFPNHYSLVTGLEPQDHGIVGNGMHDPDMPGMAYRMGGEPDTSADPRWWNEAEPVWVTAEKHGVRTATMFWPGSDYEIRGVRPSQYRGFDHSVTPEARVDQLLAWIDVPAAERPRFLTLYFSDVDSAGHEFGPDAPETDRAIAMVDRQIGRLVERLEDLGVEANIIVVADHGMAELDETRQIALNDILDGDAYTLTTAGAYVALDPNAGREEDVEAAFLAPHDHMQCWKREDVPPRLRYSDNNRIPAIICLPETGWLTIPDAKTDPFVIGNHGYDNRSPEMWAAFVAAGPAFRAGSRIGVIENTDVYPLIMQLIGVPPQPNEGRIEVFADAVETPNPDR